VRHEAELRRLTNLAALREKVQQLESEAAESRRKAEESERERVHEAEMVRQRAKDVYEREAARQMTDLQLSRNSTLEASLKRQNEIEVSGRREIRREEEAGYAARLKAEKKYQEMALKNYVLAQGQLGRGHFREIEG
jgi:type II secretory pathway component HofQ